MVTLGLVNGLIVQVLGGLSCPIIDTVPLPIELLYTHLGNQNNTRGHV